MTEFTPKSAYKVTFNKTAAHFLGQGTYPNGANLEKIEKALRGPVLNRDWQAYSDVKTTPKTVHNDGSVSITLMFGDVATRKLKTITGNTIQPAAHLQFHLQQYFDRESWAAKKNHTITVEPCALEQKI